MLWWILGGGIFLLALIVGFSFYAFRVAFYSSPKRNNNPHDFPDGESFKRAEGVMHSLIDELSAYAYEEVSVTSFDGLKLYARYYHVCDGAPLQIQVHGYRGVATRDFCGGAKLAREVGHNILLIDHRAHGKSEGKVITFGINESRDLLTWIDYAVRRFGSEQKIILTGVSMGGATVLHASSLPLPKNVVGIIADCPYSSPEAIIKKVCGGMGFPVSITMPFVKLGARLFGGFKLQGGAVNSVKECSVPILICHGEADDFVPVQMAREIFEACASEKYLFTVPNAGHGISFIEDPDGYKAQLNNFLKRIL